MAFAMLRSHNVAVEGDKLRGTIAGSWNQTALLEAPSSADFTISATLPPHSTHNAFMVGIAPSTADVTQANMYHRSGYFLNAGNGALHAQDGTNGPLSSMASFMPGGLKLGQQLRLQYLSNPTPSVWAAVDKQKFVKLCFQAPIPPGDFRPCVLFANNVTCVCFEVRGPTGGCIERPRSEATMIMEKMWTEPKFTDAEVICDGRVFKTHRSVLCAASPVFDAAFSSPMREGVEARIEIEDASPTAVEALLCHVYTGTVDTADAIQVLPVAHRYQLCGLVEQCGSSIMSDLCMDNVAETLQVLHKFSEDAAILEILEKVLSQVRADDLLFRAAMRQVRP